MAKQTQIVVIGAGYAGMIATVRLAHQTKGLDTAITLINATEHFVTRLRLHQYAANQAIPQRSIPTTLRGLGITFVQGKVNALNPGQRTVLVEIANGLQEVGYDYLLYTLGSTIDTGSVPGVREHAYTLTAYGERSAEALRQELPSLNVRGGTVLIGGGGATGIEAAAEFAESFSNLRVKLVTRGDYAAFLGQRVANYTARSLRRLGVTIQDQTIITEVKADKALTNSGEAIPFDLCLWAGGFSVPSLARQAKLAVNEQGQILIDPFMRSISHPEIYAAGDAAQPIEEPGAPMRMSAFTALVTGAHAAECLAFQLRHKAPRPLSFAYAGQGIALGRYNAIGFPTYPIDKPMAPYFTGRFGYYFREFFVAFASALPALERRVPGIFYWFGKGRYQAAKRKAAQATSVQLDNQRQHGSV